MATEKTERTERTETLSSDEVIHEIAEVLAQGDGEWIEQIANMVLAVPVVYKGDSIFEREIEEGF